MNGTGNSEGKRANSVPRFRLLDKEGVAFGPYPTAQAAMEMARELWPDQEQDEDGVGNGWDIQVVGSDLKTR